jgi:N-acyl-D-aspartate/D-glutamate deacylase
MGVPFTARILWGVLMHDLVIRGGSVVDGSGRPARTADVAIANGCVAEIGRDVGPGRREIDADGLLVAPWK